MDIVVFTPIALGITIAVTQFAKKLGLNPWLAPILEVLFGGGLVVVGFAAGAVILPANLPGAPWFWAGLHGLMTGLAAAGFYTDRKTASEVVST